MKTDASCLIRLPQAVPCLASYSGPLPNAEGDIFVFDYGSIVFWGLSRPREQLLLNAVLEAAEGRPLTPSELELDEFVFRYADKAQQSITNNVITMHMKFQEDHKVMILVSWFTKLGTDVAGRLDAQNSNDYSNVQAHPSRVLHAPAAANLYRSEGLRSCNLP